MSMTYLEAKKKVQVFLNREADLIRYDVYEPAIEFEYGWIFLFDQIGVFHPDLDNILSKVKGYLTYLDEEEILNKLNDEERKVYDNAVGLVGQAPVAIDKETAQISYLRDSSIETYIQTVIEQKTGSKFFWKVYLDKKIKINVEQVKTLRQELHLSSQEVMLILKKARNGIAAFEISIHDELITLKTILERSNLKFVIEEKKVTIT